MTYRAGLIGVGGVGSTQGEYLAAGEGIELVAIADVSTNLLEEYGDEWNVPADRRYTTHEAMLASEDLDVVSVATPTYLHHRHAIDAATSQSPPDVIWCEKPIADSVAKAEEMVDTCAEAGIELVVNHSRRWTDELQSLHSLLVDERVLGDVRAVNASWFPELLRDGTHLVDMLVYLLEGDAVRVSGYLTGEEEITAGKDPSVDVDDSFGGGYFVTGDGTFVTVDATFPRELSTNALLFIGTEGKMYVNEHDGEWRYWRLTDGEHVEESLPALEGGWAPTRDDYFGNAVENVVGVLDGTARNRSPGSEAVQTIEILVAMFVSHYTESHVSLPLERPMRRVSVTSW